MNLSGQDLLTCKIQEKRNEIELCENKSGGNGNGEIIKWTIEPERNLAPRSITHKWPNCWAATIAIAPSAISTL